MKSKPVCILFLLIALGGYASSLSATDFRQGTPTFDPTVFFRGVTHSTGVVEDRSGEPTGRLRVAGEGRLMPDGTFQLVQKVKLGDDATRSRTWVLSRVDAHRLTTTLTDASGPVALEAYRDVVHLRYPMKTPAFGKMEQWMYLQPDGRAVINEATVRVLGIVVAHLSERITQMDDR